MCVAQRTDQEKKRVFDRQECAACMNCVMLEAAVLDDVPDGTRLCIVRRLRFLVGAVELKRLVLLQLSRSCSWLLLPTLYSL